MVVRTSWLMALVATVLLGLATAEIVFCSECSPDSCAFAHSPSSQHRPISHSGDDCLCCCAHLLLTPTARIEPVQTVLPADAAPVFSVQIVAARPPYRPPRA